MPAKKLCICGVHICAKTVMVSLYMTKVVRLVTQWRDLCRRSSVNRYGKGCVVYACLALHTMCETS